MPFRNISVNRYGAIVRKDTEERLHSDWWVPTMIAHNGYIEYHNRGDIYYVEHPKTKYYVYGRVGEAVPDPGWNEVCISAIPPDKIHIPKSDK